MPSHTFEELKVALKQATAINDTDALVRCADALEAIGTDEANALAASARGNADRFYGNFSQALEHFHRALATFEGLGDRAGLARATGNIGIVHHHTSDYAAALDHYHRAIAIYEDLGDIAGVASITCNNGIVLMSMGNYPEALEYFHRALGPLEELGDRASVAIVLVNIGSVHNATGNYPLALEHCHRALAIHEELGNRAGIGIVTGNIGVVHKITGNYPLALEHYHRALAVHEELGNRESMAIVTGNIGSLHHGTGNYAQALEHFHRALAAFEELGNRAGVAGVTDNIGDVHNSTGDYLQALEHFHRALAIYEELGDSAGVASVTSNFLATYVSMGSDVEARAALVAMDAMHIDETDVRIAREQQRATLQQRSGDLDAAAITLQQALAQANEQGLRSRSAEVHKSLRDLALMQNNLAGYVEHNNEFTLITEEINGRESTLKMAMQEKQREIDAREKEVQKHMAVLHSTLPKHVAERVARGEVVNDHYENATVIFIDIVGFTSISDRIPSGHVVHLLEQIFTTLDAVCVKHDVIKIKTIGDSYMAVAFENVTNAASCALDMIASLDALEITMPPALGDTSWTKDIGDIKVRIGIHCGPVTAGVIGTQRMQYDVWGDTVNVASRMESTSEPGRIHISEAFATLLPATSSGDSFERPLQVLERGEIEVKGKGMMKTYWLGSTSA